MKKALYISLLTMIVYCFSCEKEVGAGSILCTIKSCGNVIPQATVYLKAGAEIKPDIPLSEYDEVRSTDAYGQVYFEGLSPQTYYLFVTGYNAQSNK